MRRILLLFTFLNWHLSRNASWQTCLRRKKWGKKQGERKQVYLHSIHAVILAHCLLYSCLLISSKLVKRGKHTLKKSCQSNNLDLISIFNPQRQGNCHEMVMQSKGNASPFAVWRHLQSRTIQRCRLSSQGKGLCHNHYTSYYYYG